MDILNLLYDADRIVHIALNAAIAIMSIIALRRTRQAFFGLITAGALLQVCLSSMLFISTGDRLFHLVYRSAVLIAVALLGSGFLLLIRYVLLLSAKRPNQSLQ